MNRVTLRLKLPIWLKMFANSERPESREIDPEIIEKIARAIVDRKSVVVLQRGEPIRIHAGQNQGSVEIDQVDAKYVFE